MNCESLNGRVELESRSVRNYPRVRFGLAVLSTVMALGGGESALAAGLFPVVHAYTVTKDDGKQEKVTTHPVAEVAIGKVEDLDKTLEKIKEARKKLLDAKRSYDNVHETPTSDVVASYNKAATAFNELHDYVDSRVRWGQPLAGSDSWNELTKAVDELGAAAIKELRPTLGLRDLLPPPWNVVVGIGADVVKDVVGRRKEIRSQLRKDLRVELI
jgi:hypothetical protein